MRDTDQDGHFPATPWAQQQEAAFVAFHLGPALEKASLETKIWILDHNYDLWGRVLDELSRPEVSKYVDGMAWHSYIGTPDAMTRVHDMFPNKHMYFTEGGPPAHMFEPSHHFDFPPYGTGWTRCPAHSPTCVATGPDAFASGTSSSMKVAGPTSPHRRVLRRGGLVSVDTKTKQTDLQWELLRFSSLLQADSKRSLCFLILRGVAWCSSRCG